MLLTWLCAVASALQIQLRAEPQQLVAGQVGTVHLIVVAGGREKINLSSNRPPDLPTERGLTTSFLGQSSSFDNMNGSITRILEFDYKLAAIEPGTWRIGPVSLPLSNGSATAEAIEVQVVDRSAVSMPETFRASASFDATEVWEGQTVVLTAAFETRLAGSQVRWRLPVWDGLRPPQHGTPTEDQYAIDDPAGTLFVRKAYVPLVAVAVGNRDQGVALAEVTSRVGGADRYGFRSERVEQVVSERLKLNVKKLPPPPADFSGLVGDFEVSSAVEAKGPVAVGESVPWTVILTGNGVIEGFQLPKYEAEGASFYDQDAQVTARIDREHLKSTAAFHRVIVPTAPGTLALPPQRIVTFSPSRGAYVTANIELPPLTVVAGREGASGVESFSAGPAVASDPVAIDLRPTYTWGRATAPSLGPVLPVLLGLAALPGIGILGGLGLSAAAEHRRRRSAARQGPPRALAVLGSLPSDPAERLVAFDVALRRLAPRLAEVDASAPESATRAALGERMRSLQAALGRARFGNGGVDLAAFEAELRELCKVLEGST